MAKQAAVALAAAGFLLVLVLARVSHAGANQASTTSGSTSGSSSTSTESGGDFSYGSPSVAPSTGTPEAQASVS
jgi:hypothetical protein